MVSSAFKSSPCSGISVHCLLSSRIAFAHAIGFGLKYLIIRASLLAWLEISAHFFDLCRKSVLLDSSVGFRSILDLAAGVYV